MLSSLGRHSMETAPNVERVGAVGQAAQLLVLLIVTQADAALRVLFLQHARLIAERGERGYHRRVQAAWCLWPFRPAHLRDTVDSHTLTV
jgi:hypothetical protein